jgi:ABC-type sugar transport system substrate-binding protein
MNMIVAMSDEMAIAAVNVIEAAGRAGEVFVLGVDGSPNAQVEIRAGRMTGSSYIPWKAMGTATADYALRLAEGENLTGQTIDISEGRAVLLTEENINDYI